MAEITAGMVKQLREKTDAPMMECKKALTEANGDLGRAEEILRIKLGNKATKAASRVAAEGIVGVHLASGDKLAAMVELNCETDFVAKNDDFMAFARQLAELVAIKNPQNLDALGALTLNGQPVEDLRKALIGKLGENIAVRRFVNIAAKGKVSSYVHGGAKIGVLVDAVGGDEGLGRDIAMHIAASKPKALNRDGIAEAEVERERSIATEKAAESGKPAEIIAKMVEGTVQKFLKEVTLMGQPFVKDDKITIEQLLKSKSASIASFSLFVVGEGIEKKVNDFAAEVAAQAAAASKS